MSGDTKHILSGLDYGVHDMYACKALYCVCNFSSDDTVLCDTLTARIGVGIVIRHSFLACSLRFWSPSDDLISRPSSLDWPFTVAVSMFWMSIRVGGSAARSLVDSWRFLPVVYTIEISTGDAKVDGLAPTASHLALTLTRSSSSSWVQKALDQPGSSSCT